MDSQFGSSAPLRVPLDSFNDFGAAFCAAQPKGPSSLPHPSPSKAFWTHPGLSKDWPQDGPDPEGNHRVNPLAREGSDGPIEHEADMVIIGTGITGVSIALELSKLARKEGEVMKVVLLEARDFCKPNRYHAAVLYPDLVDYRFWSDWYVYHASTDYHR